jgi:polyisoprenoid-binding protein YceI
VKTTAFASALLAAALAGPALAEPLHYTIDPSHTFVSFAAPHIEAISTWRGKFDRTTSGTIVLDSKAKTGSVDIVIDATSVDTGFPKLNEHLQSPDFFDTAKYPTAEFKSDKVVFAKKAPVRIDGQLTLHGVTKPVSLKVDEFKCIIHPMLKVPYCGADAIGVIDRSEFGLDYGVKMTGSSKVKLEIQVEAKQDDAAPADAPAAAPAAAAPTAK